MNMENVWDNLTALFSGEDKLVWSDPETIKAAERDFKDPAVTDKKDAALRLAWSYVHSRNPDDVQRGKAMLQVQLQQCETPTQERDILYLLAVGHFRSSELHLALDYCDRALKVAPESRQASDLKKKIQDRIRQDGAIGVGIAATATALVIGGLVALTARRR